MLRDDTRIEKLITEATELADDECYDESILLYDEALKISKGDVKIMVDKAITLVSAEREKEALLLYESALESDPKNPDILVNAGAAFHSLGEYSNAIEMYKRALDVSPKHAAALANSGCAHAEMGHGEKVLDFQRQQHDCMQRFQYANFKNMVIRLFCISIIILVLYISRDVILRRKSRYDASKMDSQKNRDYEKYHSEWGDEWGWREDKQKKDGYKISKDDDITTYYLLIENATMSEIKSKSVCKNLP